jgi:hypothetical protein
MTLPTILCPRCLDESNGVRLDIVDGDTLTCDCGEEYTVAAIRDLIDGWLAILPWLEAHPARQLDAATVATDHRA